MESPLTIIIFGITSNLAKIKLIPALFDIFDKELLSPETRIIGVARSPKTSLELKSYLTNTLELKDKNTHGSTFKKLTQSFSYLDGHVDDPNFYLKLKSFLKNNKTPSRKIFYLAISPDLYQDVFENLKQSGLSSQDENFTRLMIEKPIGSSLATAKKLNNLLNKYFNEDQVFRLDHYLGKETLQNILAFRFGNEIFEQLLTPEHIDHIQITAAEDFGITDRGSYYDSTGALKDVGQNHILQLLTAICMDAPKEFSNQEITKKRVEVLNKLVANSSKLVLGQYHGYLKEPNVSKDSKTNTFFALKTTINLPRLSGIPIYIRSGKNLKSSYVEITVVFKVPDNRLFKQFSHGQTANLLIFRIQPDESISLRILTKKPGHIYQLEQNSLQLSYQDKKSDLTDPYERLLFDAIRGDQTFFNDAAEVEAAWKFIDRLTQSKTKLHLYKKGSWGPKESDDLIQKDGRIWINNA